MYSDRDTILSTGVFNRLLNYVFGYGWKEKEGKIYTVFTCDTLESFIKKYSSHGKDINLTCDDFYDGMFAVDVVVSNCDITVGDNTIQLDKPEWKLVGMSMREHFQQIDSKNIGKQPVVKRQRNQDIRSFFIR